jgi:hypothetical protein
MSLLISLIALIVAIGALVGCVKKTMHLQAQVDELQERFAPKYDAEAFLEAMKPFKVHGDVSSFDLRHKGMSQEELDNFIPTPTKFKQPSGEKRY